MHRGLRSTTAGGARAFLARAVALAPPITSLAIALNLAAYVGGLARPERAAQFLWLDSARPALHQALTFGFVHTGAVHLIWNLAFLFVFGGALERAAGRSALALIYAASTLTAGAVGLATSAALPTSAPVAGASAAVAGAIAAACVARPSAGANPKTSNRALAGWPVGLFVAFNLGTALSELDPAFGWRSAALNGVGAVGGLGAAILMRLAPLGGATSRRRAVARDDLQSRLAEEIAREEARRRKSVAPPAPMATLRIGARSQGMAALIDAIERGDAVEAERRLADSRQGEDLAHLDAESHWRLARLLLDADREAAAIVVGKAFLRRHGGSAEAARAQFEIGRLLARRPENRETAVDYLTSALNRSPALEASDRLQAELLVEWLESGSREATEASATEMFRLAPIDEPPRASKKSRALDLESAALAHETSELLADGPHYDLDASGPADESLFDPIEPAILPRCAEAGPPVEAPTDPPISFDLADSTPGERQAGETASVESSRGPEDTTARRSPESESNPRTDDLGAHEEKTNGVASVRLSEASSGGVEANAPARVEELWVPPANRPPLGWAETDRELLYDSRHRYAVILPLEQPADIDALVGVMAPWLRLSRLGALHAIKRSQGVLADDLELHAAQRLAGLLAGAGQGAMLVERDERLDFGEPIDALGMKFNPLGARIASAEGAHRRDWVELIGLHAGSVLVDPRAPRRSVVDLYYARPGLQTRVWEGAIGAGFILADRERGRPENLRELAETLSARAPNAIRSRAFGRWLEGSEASPPAQFASVIECDNAMLWRLMAAWGRRRIFQAVAPRAK